MAKYNVKEEPCKDRELPPILELCRSLQPCVAHCFGLHLPNGSVSTLTLNNLVSNNSGRLLSVNKLPCTLCTRHQKVNKQSWQHISQSIIVIPKDKYYVFLFSKAFCTPSFKPRVSWMHYKFIWKNVVKNVVNLVIFSLLRENKKSEMKHFVNSVKLCLIGIMMYFPVRWLFI